MEKDEISEPLLEQQTTTNHAQTRNGSRNGSPSRIRLAELGLLLLIVLLLAYNAVAQTLVILRRGSQVSRPLIYSPANDVLRYNVINAWDDGRDSKYLHGTQEETDTAWDELISGLNIRVTEEEMIRTQDNFYEHDDVVRLADGDYVGALGVWHALHCLDLLRIAVNPTAYNYTDAASQESLQIPHLYHCIDVLRHNVMCEPDMTMYRVTWVRSSKEYNNKISRSSSQRQCADWDSIAAWAGERALASESFFVRPGPFEHKDDIKAL